MKQNHQRLSRNNYHINSNFKSPPILILNLISFIFLKKELILKYPTFLSVFILLPEFLKFNEIQFSLDMTFNVLENIKNFGLHLLFELLCFYNLKKPLTFILFVQPECFREKSGNPITFLIFFFLLKMPELVY